MVSYPLFLKSSFNEIASGTSLAARVEKSLNLFSLGRIPVIKLARLAPQTAILVKALLNCTPSEASLSIFGVIIFESP